MKKISLRGHFYLILISLVLISAAIYLNWAYAHIYKGIQGGGLRQVKELVTYNFNFDRNNKFVSEPFKYVALGDSLTYGAGTDNYSEAYPYLIAEKLANQDNKKIPLTLYNYSWPGDRSSDLIEKFLPYAVSDQPNFVTVLIGVNDIHGQISASDFEANYDKILVRLSSETKAQIYVISIPYIGSDQLILPPYNFYFDYKTKQFNKIIKKLAAKYNIKYIDLYSSTVDLFKKSGDHYSADSFHPSVSGYALWGPISYDRFNK